MTAATSLSIGLSNTPAAADAVRNVLMPPHAKKSPAQWGGRLEFLVTRVVPGLLRSCGLPPALCFSSVPSRAVHIQGGHCGTLTRFCYLEQRGISWQGLSGFVHIRTRGQRCLQNPTPQLALITSRRGSSTL